jgi:hypothetical protein
MLFTFFVSTTQPLTLLLCTGFELRALHLPGHLSHSDSPFSMVIFEITCKARYALAALDCDCPICASPHSYDRHCTQPLVKMGIS